MHGMCVIGRFCPVVCKTASAPSVPDRRRSTRNHRGTAQYRLLCVLRRPFPSPTIAKKATECPMSKNLRTRRGVREYWNRYALQHISVHMRSSGICGVYLLRAEESCSFGSKYSAYLVTVEQGDQLVGHAKLPTFQCWRYHGFHSFKLLRWISPQIDFGRLNIIMPQPQRHLPDIPCGL